MSLTPTVLPSVPPLPFPSKAAPKPARASVCGLPPNGLLRFCASVDYPIDLTDPEWAAFLDEEVKYWYYTEVLSSGGSSACNAAFKALACARYFPRCTVADGTCHGIHGGEEFPPCLSLCDALKAISPSCPGTEAYECSTQPGTTCYGVEVEERQCFVAGSHRCTNPTVPSRTSRCFAPDKPVDGNNTVPPWPREAATPTPIPSQVFVKIADPKTRPSMLKGGELRADVEAKAQK